jgi:hypothetical protein
MNVCMVCSLLSKLWCPPSRSKAATNAWPVTVCIPMNQPTTYTGLELMEACCSSVTNERIVHICSCLMLQSLLKAWQVGEHNTLCLHCLHNCMTQSILAPQLQIPNADAAPQTVEHCNPVMQQHDVHRKQQRTESVKYASTKCVVSSAVMNTDPVACYQHVHHYNAMQKSMCSPRVV